MNWLSKKWAANYFYLRTFLMVDEGCLFWVSLLC